MIETRTSGARWLCCTVLLVAGCTTAWHVVPMDAVTSGQRQSFKRILLITRDGYERELIDVVVRSDSLIGIGTDSAHQRHAVALPAIVRIESREPDPAPALAAVGGFALDVATTFVKMVGLLATCIVFRC